MNRIGKCFALLLAVALLAAIPAGGAAAEREITLPDGTHFLRIPEEMIYQAPSADETSLKGIWLLEPELEMLIFSYEAQNATVDTLAEALVNAGRQAQVREIGGTEFLVFQDRDEADGAPCVGYSYLADGRMVEITFFYATQAAMDLTRTIMESYH